ncbi:MAG: ribose 5-phosphate isomerase A [Candidatus Poseidoniia archaeon]|nr:ribose 5-phosphate isomerase A [Candidatus Poseidoniia archaeon]
MNQEFAKKNAAKEAVKFVEHGMTVGLGTGSTASIVVDLLGNKLSENFQITGMPTSIETKKQAEKWGMDLIGIEDRDSIDIAIDGADEVSPSLDLIKGLGGALLREKKVERKAKELIIIVDETKIVERLGVGPLPVEVGTENHGLVAREIEKQGCQAKLRIEESGDVFVTDNKNYIYHCHFPEGIKNPEEMDARLLNIDGVKDTGLFVNMATKVIIGKEKSIEIWE